MVDLAPGSRIRVVNPSAVVKTTMPGVVTGMWLKEGPPGPPGESGHVITVTDSPPANLEEGALVYDTDDPGIDGSEFVMRVLYDGTPYPPRPPVVYVEWVGPIEPDDWVEGDTWLREVT